MSDSEDDDISTDPSDYSDVDLSSNESDVSSISTYIHQNNHQIKHQIMDSNHDPFLKIIINNLYKTDSNPSLPSSNTNTPKQQKQTQKITNTKFPQSINSNNKEQNSNHKTPNNTANTNNTGHKHSKIEQNETVKKPVQTIPKRKYTKRNKGKKAKNKGLDRHSLQKESLDSLLAKALSVRPNLRWNIDNEWCRYCGARAANSFHTSVWGYKTLCYKHYTLWKQNRVDLSNAQKPNNIESVTHKSECSERKFLINILMKYQTLNVNNHSLFSFEPRKRMLRQKKQNKNSNNASQLQFETSESDMSQSHSSQNEESDDEFTLNDQEIDEEYYSAKIVNKKRKRVHESDSMSSEQEENDGSQYMERVREMYKRKKRKTAQMSFHCPDCDGNFVSPKEFKSHSDDMHQNKAPFSCDKCDGIFQYYNNLNTHTRRVHDKVINYRCTVCDRGFFDKFQCRTHCKTHMDSASDTHSVSVESVSKEDSAHVSAMKKRKPPTFKCSYCPKVFDGKYERKEHILNRHTSNKNKLFKCVHCSQAFGLKKYLKTHISNKHGKYVRKPQILEGKHRKKKWKCHICKKKFKGKEYLNIHLRSAHSNLELSESESDEGYECDKCEYRTQFREKLEKHSMIHCGEKPFECRKCQKRFRLKKYVKHHMKKAHKKSR